MLNYWKIGTNIIDHGIDASPEQYGRFIPVVNMPILQPHSLDDVDCVLLLAWVFKKEIMEKEQQFIQNGGAFLIPFPEPHFSP